MNTHIKTLDGFLIIGTLASLVLWMPFGVGYYGWPWRFVGWRVAIYLFVVAFPLCAAIGCFIAFRGGFSFRRFVLPFVALLVGIFGVFALSSWLSRYVEPALHTVHVHPSSSRLTPMKGVKWKVRAGEFFRRVVT